MNRVTRIVNHLDQTNAGAQVEAIDCAFMDNVTTAPMDAILGLNTQFQADKDPRKVNVGIGAYRTDDGKPYVLEAVRQAEIRILEDKTLNKEYLPQRGDDGFTACARDQLFGDALPNKEKRITTVQTLSGTGALRVGAEFIKRFLPGRDVYLSDPTWGTHMSILDHASVAHKKYRYWDASKRGLNIQGMLEDIAKSPMGSIFMLHAVAHNPTGVDPTADQWKQICKAMHMNGNIAWFDVAYQGFATGDLEKDGFAIRYFADSNIPLIATQSFAKNFGLYSERIGSFNVVCANADSVEKVRSQLDIIIRNLYSNPPKHGALIVKTILNSPELTALWKRDLKMMSDRINSMRVALRAAIEKCGTPGDWSHITSQIGMFSFTGLSKNQSEHMVKEHHIYMLGNGRISMAGVTTKNVDYIAKALDQTVRTVK